MRSWFVLFIIWFLPNLMFGSFDSIAVNQTTVSCKTSTVYIKAYTTRSPVFYILKGNGIVKYSITGTFYNLFSGSYTVNIFDPFQNDTTINIYVSLGYNQLYHNIFIEALCNDKNRTLKINTYQGVMPYRWYIYRNSEDTLVSNQNELLNPPIGNYLVKSKDSCNSEVTSTIKIDSSSYIPHYNSSIYLSQIDCIYFKLSTFFNSNQFLLEKVIIQVNNNIELDSTLYMPFLYFSYEEKNLFVTRNDKIKIYYITTCNDTFIDTTIRIYESELSSSMVNNKFVPYCQIYPINFKEYSLYFKYNYKFKFTTLSHQILYSNDNVSDKITFDLTSKPIGEKYLVEAQNLCNNHYFYDTIIVPIDDTIIEVQTDSFNIKYQIYPSSSIDSTANLLVNSNNLQAVYILSGPNLIKSSNIAFKYSDYNDFNIRSDINYKRVLNLAAGKYILQLNERCKLSYDTIEIPNHLLKKVEQYKYEIIQNSSICNEVQIAFKFYLLAPLDTIWESEGFNIMAYYSYNRSLYINGKFYTSFNYYTQIFDSLRNEYGFILDTVKINLTKQDQSDVNFQVYSYFNKQLNDILYCNISRSIIFEKNIISPPITYQKLKVNSITNTQCDTNYNIKINLTGGKPPFTYEVYQDTNYYKFSTPNFVLTKGGYCYIYITDDCQNVIYYNYFIDTAKVLPFKFGGLFCLNHFAQIKLIQSDVATHKIIKPDGSLFFGDTLTLNPFTTQDIGHYKIYEYVHINTCKDSFFIEFDLSPFSYETKNVSFCEFDSIKLFNKVITSGGIYRDTVNTKNCDSIYTYNATKIPLNHVFRSIDLCKGGICPFNQKRYYSSTEFTDTFKYESGDQCKSIVKTQISVSDYIRDTFYDTICFDQYRFFHSKKLSETGKYIDTSLKNNCMTIETLYLTKKELERETWNDTVCFLDYYIMNGKKYFNPGTYKDTFLVKTTDKCKKEITLNLSKWNLEKVQRFDTICYNDTLVMNGKNYFNSGIYKDTFLVNKNDKCRREVTLTLSQYPKPTLPMDTPKTIDSFGETTVLTSCLTGLAYDWVGLNSYSNRLEYVFQEEYNPVTCKVQDSFGCWYACHYFVQIKGDDGYVQLPNAFSPNGDMVNDSLILQIYHAKIDNFFIANRWGEIIYRYSEKNPFWDGRYKGELCNLGAYGYFMEYVAGFRKYHKTKSGTINLFR